MRSLSVLLLCLTACAAGVSPYARATAGRIGCPAREIEIRDTDDYQTGPRSWVAVCSGTVYACSSSGDIGSANSRVVCSARDHGGEHPREHEHEHDDEHERGDD